jgi:hypothetical protein
MTGGGLYGINKIAKTVENRPSSPSPNSSQNPPRDAYAGLQGGQGGYWGPPPLAPMRDTRDAYYSDRDNYGDYQAQPQEGRYWYPPPPNWANGARALPSRSHPPREEYSDDEKFEEQYYQAADGNGRNDRVNPPAYGTQRDHPPRSQMQGQVFDDGRGGRGGRGGPSNVSDLSDIVMSLVGGEEGGKMGSKLGNRKEIIRKLFK